MDLARLLILRLSVCSGLMQMVAKKSSWSKMTLIERGPLLPDRAIMERSSDSIADGDRRDS